MGSKFRRRAVAPSTRRPFERVIPLLLSGIVLPGAAHAANGVATAGTSSATVSAAQGGIVSIDRSSDANTSSRQATPAPTLSAQRAISGLQQAVQPNLLPPPMPGSPAGDAAASTASGSMQGADRAAPADRPAAVPAAPDERPLWRLLQAGDLARLDAAIAAVWRAYPNWSPPTALVREEARQKRERDIARALTGDLPLLRQLLVQMPDEFGCDHVDRAWRAADLLSSHAGPSSAPALPRAYSGTGGDRALIYALYQRIVPSCASDVNRIVTLQRSVAQLPPAQVDALFAEEQAHGVRSVAVDRTWTHLLDARELDRLDAALASDAGKTALSAAGVKTVRDTLSELQAPIRASQDSAAATRAGWFAYRLAQLAPEGHAASQLAAAAAWFASGVQYAMLDASAVTDAKSDPESDPKADPKPDPKSDAAAKTDHQTSMLDATLGLAQVRVSQRNPDAAEQLLQGLHRNADARVRALTLQIALLRADAAYRRKDYRGSLQALEQAKDAGAAPEQIDAMQGWSYYALGDYRRAEAAFDTHYRRMHDDDGAEGLALTRRALGASMDPGTASTAGRETIASGAGRGPDPLRAYEAALRAQQLYYQKQFVAAQSQWQTAQDNGADAQRIAHYMPGDLRGIDAASVTTGLSWSDHVGTQGQGRLNTLTPTIEAQWFDRQRSYDLTYRQHLLSDGAEHVNAEQLNLQVSDSVQITGGRILQVYGAVGATQGGAVGVTPQAEASVGQTTASHAWTAFIGTSPVKDSLRSWRGVSQPVQGGSEVTGGVTRQRVGGTTSWQFAPRWNASVGGDVEWLTGRHVLGNQGAKADAAVGYDVAIPGFDYVSIGPALHYLGYRRNENFYVAGQGGYYSPQMSVSTGIALQLLSAESALWQWSGNMEVGFNTTRQSAGDCPSAAQDAGSCGGGNNTGVYSHLQFAGVRRLSAQWQVGGLMDLNVTPGRDKQFAAIAFVRYFMSPRAAVFSVDLPKNTTDFHTIFDDGR